MSYMLQPQILLMKEGTENSKGKDQLIANINACLGIVEVVRTTLGPRGSDKLIKSGDKSIISNDGATIIKLLDIGHPAAKTLTEVAISQDNEVGDGTTSVTVFAGELLKEAKSLVEDGISPQIIISGYYECLNYAREKLKELSHPINEKSIEDKNDMLIRCAATSLNTKLIAPYKDFFSKMVVSAVERLEDFGDKSLIGIKHVLGGSISDSFLVDGVAFKKTFSYAGFEQQPKKFKNPKIITLNVELELKSEKENAEVRIENPNDYQSIVDAEWKIIYTKLENIVNSGAQVVLSKLPIGDLATQYFADRDIFCAGRVADEDMKRVTKATGAVINHSCNDIREESLGTCGFFEEKQVGADRYNIFETCTEAKSSTIVLRGGAEQFIEEAERSIHDAVMVVKRAIKANSIIPGAGAIEMELSKHIKKYALAIQGKEQLVGLAFAKSLEVIPRQLAHNAGLDAVDLINKLRQKHELSNEGANFGINVYQGGLVDAYSTYIWEPTMLKNNVLGAATEAACLILSVDQTVRNPKSEQAQQEQRKQQMGRGGVPGFRGR
jgi:T-complex protein 1 subunit eta